VDFVALSFVRKPATCCDFGTYGNEADGKAGPIIAKIEKPEGWDNLETILDVTDGVMVARGDLGVEMALERVPAIQKSIIRRRAPQGALCDHGDADARVDDENGFPTRGRK
jgi:pyruvate kinase